MPRLLRIGKSGQASPWAHARTVYPYDDRGKGRRYSKGWRRVKAGRAWMGSI